MRWYSPRDYIIKTVVDNESGDTVEKGDLIILVYVIFR